MATNKKFRIQNGVDIHGGGLSIDDVTVIGADGKVVPSAIADAVAGLTSSDIADLQAQVSAILGTSPETLDTLQEIVAAFENADSSLTGSVAQNAADIATINTTLTNGVATPTDVADLQSQVTSNDTDIAANAAAIAAANSRTSGISTSSGSSNIQMTAEVDMDSNKVTNMADPTAAQDAATKAYVDAASTGSSSSLATETAARIAGDSANEADATAKADAAEASAKAHADAGDASLQGQIDIIVGSSPSTLDTLQEIVTAFENADSTLTGAVAQNSTDIAAETARATAAEQANASSISALDTFVTGALPVGFVAGSSDIGISSLASHGVTFPNGIVSSGSVPGSVKLDRNFGPKAAAVAVTLEVGKTYALSYIGGGYNDYYGNFDAISYMSAIPASIRPSGGHEFSDGYAHSSMFSVNSDGSVADPAYEATIQAYHATEQGVTSVGQPIQSTVAYITPDQPDWHLVFWSGSGAIDIASISIQEYSHGASVSLDTTATQVVPAINEVVSSVASLTSGTSSDLAAETSARIAGDASTLSSASSDATSKADAAEAAAVATASADATSKANAAQAAAEATASADATSKADAAEASAKAHADSGDATVQAAVDVVSGRVDAILNGSGESLDTIVEVVAAFENADSDLQTLITSNATAVSAETARAQGVETSLQSSIDSLTSSTSGDVSGLQGQIDDEEAARISGDSSLQSQLNSEISRATSAEAVNAANIASEITARSNADAAIEADVVSLQNQVGTILGGAPGTLDTFVEIINAFEGADSDLQAVISSNSTRLTTAENNITALEADLTAEENARASGDSALQAQITANDTDIASNASAISAEETRATAAESGLQSQITSNDADIAALQTRAGTIEGKDADQDVAIAANASAIAAETSRAQTAESGISSDLAAEVSRAQGAEAALQSSIDFVKQNTDPAALDSLTEIVAAFQAADGSITSVVSSNTTRISALEGSVTGIEAWNTDNVSEGSTNLYFTEARAKACVGADANSCIDYDEASGKFSLDISETEGALVPDNATNADQLDGQHGEYYRINIYNVAGTLVN